MFQQFFDIGCFLYIVVPVPAITTQPTSVIVRAGTTATFTVIVSGEGLTYQWFGPDGVLSDTSGEIAGSSTNTLQILNVQEGDTGNYQVRVVNAAGGVESDVTSLTLGELLVVMIIWSSAFNLYILIAAPRFIFRCFSELQCSGDSFGLRATGSADIESRECCVNTQGRSYQLNGQCFDCTGICLSFDSFCSVARFR